jgi:hypothetical protein
MEQDDMSQTLSAPSTYNQARIRADYPHYSEGLCRALFFGAYLSRQSKRSSLEIEHLLLGMIRQDRKILNAFGVPTESVRTKLEAWYQWMPYSGVESDIPFDQATRRVLEYAVMEASQSGHQKVGRGHLLLGIMQEGTSVAASILADEGLRIDEVRRCVATVPEDRAALEPEKAAVSAGDGGASKKLQCVLVITRRPLMNGQSLLEQIVNQEEMKGYVVSSTCILACRTGNPDDRLFAVAAIKAMGISLSDDIAERMRVSSFKATDGNDGQYFTVYDRP